MWDLVPWAGIKPRLLALGAQKLSHWATREVWLVVSYFYVVLFWRVLIPLASGVCPLMDEFGPGAWAGLLVGGTGACPLVGGVGSCPSVGRAMSVGVFWGVFELSMTSGSLSADGWSACLSGWLAWSIPALEPAGCSVWESLPAKMKTCRRAPTGENSLGLPLPLSLHPPWAAANPLLPRSPLRQGS